MTFSPWRTSASTRPAGIKKHGSFFSLSTLYADLTSFLCLRTSAPSLDFKHSTSTSVQTRQEPLAPYLKSVEELAQDDFSDKLARYILRLFGPSLSDPKLALGLALSAKRPGNLAFDLIIYSSELDMRAKAREYGGRSGRSGRRGRRGRRKEDDNEPEEEDNDETTLTKDERSFPSLPPSPVQSFDQRRFPLSLVPRPPRPPILPSRSPRPFPHSPHSAPTQTLVPPLSPLAAVRAPVLPSRATERSGLLSGGGGIARLVLVD